MAVALRRHGVSRMAVIDRHQVGASFLSWPQETRFITPSFYSNPFGLADLNAVTETSSPALTAAWNTWTGRAMRSTWRGWRRRTTCRWRWAATSRR
nr:NAD(P)-binding domain-containing protein [Achromobacter insuavis]